MVFLCGSLGMLSCSTLSAHFIPEHFAGTDFAGAWSDKDGGTPLNLLFHIDFENEFTASEALGAKEPTNENLPTLVEGINGKAARFDEGQVLRYLAPGNLNKQRGAISLWIQTPVDGVGVPGTDYFVFREERGDKKAYNAMDIWLEGDWEMRFHPRAVKGYLHVPEIRDWLKGEWHHLIINWDAATGRMFGYTDGLPRNWTIGGGASWSYSPEAWKPKDNPAFYLGAASGTGAKPWQGAIDEVRIFDRPLTPAEAREEYLRFGRFSVKVSPVDCFLYAGKKEDCRLLFENISDTDAALSPRYEIRNTAGEKVLSGDVPPVKIPAGKAERVIVSLNYPRPDTYDMTVTFTHNGHEEKQVVRLRALPQKEGAPASEEHLSLVTRIDAVNPPAIVESAPSKIVDSPLGKYREVNRDTQSRFAIPFQVEKIGVPHLAVVTIPDDKPRTMEIDLQNLDGIDDRQLQAGFMTGEEYPVSNTMIEQRLVFWPKSKNNSLIFMTDEDGYPAAVQSFSIYKMEGLPSAKGTSFKGSVPPRQIGVYYEDPVMPKNYGGTASFPGFVDTVDSMLDYMEWFGQNILIYPVIWYRGPLYRSSVEPFAPYPSVRPHPYDYPEYVLKRLNARDMKFFGVFAIHELPSLTPYAITDMNRVAAGEETTINVRNDDTLTLQGRHPDDPDFNPLDPRIQQKVKDLAAEFLDRYGDEPALTGLVLLCPRHKLIQFGSANSGYNDINLKGFQKETEVKIPVDPKDPKRFSKSYEWLRENAWEKWIDWRCRKIHDYYKEIADIVRNCRPDLKLVIGIVPRQDNPKRENDYPKLARYIPESFLFSKYLREMGIDVKMFRNDENVVFNYLPREGSLRFLRSRDKEVYGWLKDCRTLLQAPEIVAPLKEDNGAMYTMFDRYWESAIGEHEPLPLKSIAVNSATHEAHWRVTSINPNTFHCLENYAAGLNNLDALSLTKGGFVVGTQGMESYLARFSRAFVTLPAVNFNDVEELSDPVRVRQRVVDGMNYFYVLNRLPLEVEVTVRLSDNHPLTDLVSDEKVLHEGTLTLCLAPYDLRTFRSDSEKTLVTGGNAALSDEFKKDLQQRLAKVERALENRKTNGEDIAERLPYLEYAHTCLKENRYARLYFLLQEGWVVNEIEKAPEEKSTARKKRIWSKNPRKL